MNCFCIELIPVKNSPDNYLHKNCQKITRNEIFIGKCNPTSTMLDESPWCCQMRTFNQNSRLKSLTILTVLILNQFEMELSKRDIGYRRWRIWLKKSVNNDAYSFLSASIVVFYKYIKHFFFHSFFKADAES